MVYRARVALVRDGGEYSGNRNSHRSTHPHSTPNPADSQQKIKRDKKKSQSSALSVPLLSFVITAINNTGHSYNIWSSSFCAVITAFSRPIHFPPQQVRYDFPLFLFSCSAFSLCIFYIHCLILLTISHIFTSHPFIFRMFFLCVLFVLRFAHPWLREHECTHKYTSRYLDPCCL